ncbi:MAG TPA: HD-GYP domain-containing protein [Clostridia bacterium]
MSRKMKVDIDACKPRMVTAETIYSDYGAVIVWENTVLDALTINRLKIFGIEELWVYEYDASIGEPKESKPRSEAEVFSESYENDTEQFKTILHDLSVGKTVSIEKTVQIADSIYAKKDKRRQIIECITQIRKVDEYTYYHSINVSMLAMLIGKWLRLKPEDNHLLVQAGLLHDIGKSRIPAAIINKPGKLEDEELAEMKKHSEYGYYLVQYMDGINKRVQEAVLYHHEREDGSGYPVGLKGEQIPLFAKVLAVADTFDAMTADRSYTMKNSPFKVFQLMQNDCFGYLDTIILNTFLSNISHYYVGNKVKLNDGRTAEVIYINPQQYGKPVIKIGNEYIDLTVAKNVRIEELL